MTTQDGTSEIPTGAGSTLTDEQMRGVAMQHLKAWNAHDVDAVLERVTEDVVWSQPGARVRGRAAAAEEVRAFFVGFPDLEIELSSFEVFCNVEKQAMVTSWTASGTMEGPLRGVPPTGRTGDISGTTLTRFRGDRVAENHIVFDGLLYLQQLGLLPASDSPAFKALVMGEVMVGKAWGAVQARLATRRGQRGG